MEQEFFIVSTEPILSSAIGPSLEAPREFESEPTMFFDRLEAELFAKNRTEIGGLTEEHIEYRVWHFIAKPTS